MAAVVLFDRAGNWKDTLVCDRRMGDALHALGAVRGKGPPRGRALRGLHVLQPDGEAGVFYLPRKDGWLGVLCDAGEWIAVPPALAAPDEDARRALPAPDAFIEHFLALLGEDADDAA